ncbi:unnamed protein product [Paramecium octaurelia]|uniref:Transmembrane protein n=1 Tax=Paramecium octaurelia TaxID=43137 RepID=A0A8S1UG96_PAROT|nr:unnamed protein product [Paramecium octaurelia]
MNLEFSHISFLKVTEFQTEFFTLLVYFSVQYQPSNKFLQSLSSTLIINQKTKTVIIIHSLIQEGRIKFDFWFHNRSDNNFNIIPIIKVVMVISLIQQKVCGFTQPKYQKYSTNKQSHSFKEFYSTRITSQKQTEKTQSIIRISNTKQKKKRKSPQKQAKTYSIKNNTLNNLPLYSVNLLLKFLILIINCYFLLQQLVIPLNLYYPLKPQQLDITTMPKILLDKFKQNEAKNHLINENKLIHLKLRF